MAEICCQLSESDKVIKKHFEDRFSTVQEYNGVEYKVQSNDVRLYNWRRILYFN